MIIIICNRRLVSFIRFALISADIFAFLNIFSSLMIFLLMQFLRMRYVDHELSSKILKNSYKLLRNILKTVSE